MVFGLKAIAFRARRTIRDTAGRRPRSFVPREIDNDAPVIGKVVSPLYTSGVPAGFALQAGKVQNLRVAARSLNGVVIPAGEVFSFWAHVPRPTRRAGFVEGRELREGCVVPSIGGGLCQLSNGLYDAALQAGCEIVERHAHSRQLPGSVARLGRDATVFWNYVDLRFRIPAEAQLEVRLTADDLIVAFRMAQPAPVRATDPLSPPPGATRSRVTVESCETCGATGCFRHAAAAALPNHGITAWVLDAFQPEFDAWMSRHCSAEDWQFVPLDSSRHRVGPYFWSTIGQVRQAPGLVLRRSLTSRRLAAQGAERQRALLKFDAELASSFGRRLPYRATHLVVSQNLLPFLWQRGDLGGRTFDVLMTRLPLAELERVLDLAFAAQPKSSTLADFRAPPALVEAEMAALAAARHWITPHSATATLAGDRAIKLDWQLPPPQAVERGPWIVFPAATLGRKGAWEVRAFARKCDLPVKLAGPVLECPGFWDGVRIERPAGDWLAGARLVLLPAWVEHQPRRLLRAVAAGVPVVASRECGLEGVPGVLSVPAGDVDAIHEAICSICPEALSRA